MCEEYERAEVCRTVKDFASYCLRDAVKEDAVMKMFDDGDLCDVEVEMMEGAVTLCAALPSKNVDSVAAYKLASIINRMDESYLINHDCMRIDEDTWLDMKVLVSRILCL